SIPPDDGGGGGGLVPKLSDEVLEEGSPELSQETLKQIEQEAQTLYTRAKAQEAGFKQLLEGLDNSHNTLELGALLKSKTSIVSKLTRKQGRVESLNDLLRGAVIVPSKEQLDRQLVLITTHLREQGIPHKIEYKENASGYRGVHVQFTHNDVPAEIQVHTAKNWEIKKRQDGSYHIAREEETNPTLTKEEWEHLIQESKRLGQESDLDINLFTSFEVISTESSSAASLNLRKSENDLNLTHILRLKSNSKTPSSPGAEIAYT
ncbi:hypothetical protein ACFOPX_08530, partial [Helicobacter baculiformis]